MKSLVWLASFPKSGNTWVRAVLTAYLTDARGPFDFKWMDRFTVSESSYRDFIAKSGTAREDLDEATVDLLRKEVQHSLTQRQQRPFWVKTHNANILHNGQRLIFPEFTRAAIYVVRNPLDVVDSLADHSGRTIDQAIRLLNDPKHALGGPKAVHVKQYLGTWSQHVRSWIEERQFPVLLLRYEDMHAETYGSFRRVLEFLGWPLDDARLQRALDRTAFCQLQEAEKERGFAERNASSRSGRFFRRGQCNAWHSVLSHKQAELLLAQHGEVMQRVGYSLPDLLDVYRAADVATTVYVGLSGGDG